MERNAQYPKQRNSRKIKQHYKAPGPRRGVTDGVVPPSYPLVRCLGRHWGKSNNSRRRNARRTPGGPRKWGPTGPQGGRTSNYPIFHTKRQKKKVKSHMSMRQSSQTTQSTATAASASRKHPNNLQGRRP